MNTDRKSRLFVSWEPSNSRSETLARHFNADCIHIHYLSLKKPLIAPIKYVLQTFATWVELARRRPDLVFVQNPPPFAAMAVWTYCLLASARMILDSHTGVFLEKKWRWLGHVHFFLARRAEVSIVTNEYLGAMLERAGAPYFVFPDVPTEFPGAKRLPTIGDSTVTVVNSFSYDEPLAEILEAAAKFPAVDFLVTGDVERCPAELRTAAPPNVRFTGFVSRGEYIDMVYSSKAVVVLTTEDHTMQRGAYEAMSMGVPIVTSDWPLLRETFFKGATYADNSAASIIASLAELFSDIDRYRAEIVDLKRRRREIWAEKLETFSRAHLAAQQHSG